jgi:hypothetical protein
MKRTVSLLLMWMFLSMLILMGCSPKPGYWYKPNTDAEQFEDDKQECLSLVKQFTTPVYIGGVPVMPVADNFKACMKGKGYTWEEKKVN